jgi:hypothetical protein
MRKRNGMVSDENAQNKMEYLTPVNQQAFQR